MEINSLLKAHAEFLALSGFGDCLDPIMIPTPAKGASPAKLKAIEKSIGRLPDSYKEFLLNTNGLEHLDDDIPNFASTNALTKSAQEKLKGTLGTRLGNEDDGSESGGLIASAVMLGSSFDRSGHHL